MKRLLLLLAIAFACAPVFSDEITDELQLAIDKYTNGDIAGSISAVQLAESWLMEKQAADVTAVFGELPGWQKQEESSQGAGAAFMGGGVTASCVYKKADARIEATILGNSPMLGMVSGLVGNAMMAQASGAKIIKINGMRAAVKNDGDEWEVMIPYEGSALVTVRATTTKEDAVHCAEKIDWARLKAIFQSQ